MRLRLIVALLALSLPVPLAGAGAGEGLPSPGRSGTPGGMARIPGGRFTPLYVGTERSVRIRPFEIDRRQVTRGEFAEFVRTHPRWRRSAVKPVFADAAYLADWRGDLDPGTAADARRAVTNVSWFAAKSYCGAQGKRLPTIDEWEYVARASATRPDGSKEPGFRQRMLELYNAQPTGGLPEAGRGFRNVYGVFDLIGPVREWVLDFNSIAVSDDSRGTGARDKRLYCAAGALQATDPEDYGAFLRYALRAGLQARSTISNLGFRCARSL